MKTQLSPPITPVLAVIGTELAAAQELLMRFEHAISDSAPVSRHLKPQIQGFDLALQILADIEHLTGILGQHLSAETTLTDALPMSGIRLERVRAKLCTNQMSDADQQGPAQAVDLF